MHFYHAIRGQYDDHHRIYQAIVAQEPGRAEVLMREHVSSIKTSLIRPLSPARYSIAITAGFPSRNPNICKGVCA
jgi:DNA-binding GntR family transcriptional regulator